MGFTQIMQAITQHPKLILTFCFKPRDINYVIKAIFIMSHIPTVTFVCLCDPPTHPLLQDFSLLSLLETLLVVCLVVTAIYIYGL